jgi:hypothetical protein
MNQLEYHPRLGRLEGLVSLPCKGILIIPRSVVEKSSASNEPGAIMHPPGIADSIREHVDGECVKRECFRNE